MVGGRVKGMAVASQPTKVSLRANKNRWITETVDGASYRTDKAGPDKMEEFLSEIAMLKRVGRHPNIVRMLGCCTLKQPYCMLMEYVPCGDLLQYLRRLRREYERRTGGVAPFTSKATQPAPNYIDLLLSSDSDGSYIQPEVQPSGHTSISNRSGRPSLSDIESNISGHISAKAGVRQPSLEYILDPMELQNFALQIAKGMSHLEKKQITHRDLAARNILIDENKTLKISDFGLSRSGIYINSRHKKFPLRWVSVEAIRDKLYSSKSDVWSFAIVLWEIGTLGGFPYPTVDDHDVLSFLLEGNRLEKPDNCTEELYVQISQFKQIDFPVVHLIKLGTDTKFQALLVWFAGDGEVEVHTNAKMLGPLCR
uniref:Protein kinase domain-containing protein n=1 Tax=Timema bartmani TaxID=61472 RepID=A0A7R9EN93_9NEOP|nr:unnamed protein product [Timema bartmani]